MSRYFLDSVETGKTTLRCAHMGKDREPGVLPMRTVLRLTGLNADVVRAWERRYGAITPERTEGNARRYSHTDVERLKRLSSAVAAGHAISAVAKLSDAELDALAVRESTADRGRDLIDRYLAAIARFDLAGAEELLARAVRLGTPREVALDLLAPLMREVGIRWHNGTLSIAEEHAASAQVRGAVASLLFSAPYDRSAARVVLAAPAGQRHEIGALLGAVFVAERGLVPVFLGPDVPFAELTRVVHAIEPRLVVLSLVWTRGDVDSRAERRAIAALARTTEVWIGAPADHPAASLKNVRTFHDYTSFETALACVS
jgi:DNA-binding transcriptional MerR regulator